MNKFCITILFATLTHLFAQGQTGYVDLTIIDSNGDSNSYGGQVQFIGASSDNNKSELYFGNAIYQLNTGDYSIIIPNGYVKTIENNVRLVETSDTLKFSIANSDTLKLKLKTKIDTLYPTNKKDIDLLGLKGDFYCYDYDCTDSNNKKFGLELGYYCQIAGISGNIYSVYVADTLILQIKTENQNKTYCYNFQIDPNKKIEIEKYSMDYDEILSFIRENINQGELKQELIWKNKKI